MSNEKIIRDMMSKCKIYYDNLLISSEDVIKRFMDFFSMQFINEQKTTSFLFHTGSLCFDIVSLVSLMMVCFIYNLTSNDELLQTLDDGDIVLYNEERYHWNGIIKMKPSYKSSPQEYICLSQDPKGRNGGSKKYIPYENNKHLIKPYFGEAVATDGRGIRKSNSNRNEFLSYILGVAESDVPSIMNISVVVIADKNTFIDVCNHVRISYINGKSIHLTDVIPVSYYTSGGEEYQIGKNPAKTEAVIKVVNKVSTARELVLDKQCNNKVVGIMVTNTDMSVVTNSEFKDLIRRKSLKFSLVIGPYNSEVSNIVIDQHEDVNIFAFTKEILSTVSTNISTYNRLTLELNKQVKNILNHETNIAYVNGSWNWNEYKNLKDAIYAIKQSNWREDVKENFIKHSLGLINLYTSAFFPLEIMEKAIHNSIIKANVMLPMDRIQELISIGQQNISMKEQSTSVVQALLKMYCDMKTISNKEKVLMQILSENKDKKIALVFPKAYYSSIFYYYYNTGGEYNNVICTTANSFDNKENYELIIVVCDTNGKRFDPILCYSSSKIIVLLYECEVKLFKYKKRQNAIRERKLNARIKGLDYEKEVSAYNDDILYDLSYETIREYNDLEEYLENIEIFDLRKLIANSSSIRTNTSTAEVKYVGIFVTGEQILFSKNYKAVLYNSKSHKVTEISPDRLITGDTLVFTKRDDFTRNIVDMIIEQLVFQRKISKQIQDAIEKSLYWKAILKEYKERNYLSYRNIAQEMSRYGSTLQEMAIRQWLDDDSHIIGPRDIKTMEIIGRLTNDKYLQTDYKTIFDSCRIVRHFRREILSLIAQAINEKLSNKVPDPGSAFEVVYEHVDKLSEIMELENVYELDDTIYINSNMVNRPITEVEVIL